MQYKSMHSSHWACTETIANQITNCEGDAFLGLDLTSLSQIFQQTSKNEGIFYRFGSRSDRKICYTQLDCYNNPHLYFENLDKI